MDGGALAAARLRPDPAAVALHHAAGGGELDRVARASPALSTRVSVDSPSTMPFMREMLASIRARRSFPIGSSIPLLAVLARLHDAEIRPRFEQEQAGWSGPEEVRVVHRN